jgi:hypothetical protein
MKYFKPITLILVLASIIFIAYNCGTMGTAVGDDDIVYVFADSTDWPLYEEPLNNIFGKYVRTPIMEREYLLRWVPFDKFNAYKKSKNIFILGRLNSNDPVSENVKSLLNKDIIEGVKTGKYFYIPKKDVWVRDQYVLFFVANSVDDMIQKIIDLGELAYQDFRKYYFTRLRDEMFEHMEQKKLEKYIADHFPFTMRVQHDYFIADESLQENYVWIRRFDPDRSILIHWLPKPDTFQLTSRWIIDERNRLAKKVFHGDKVVEEETQAFSINFKGWNAIKLEGTWKNDSLQVGGPFRDITFIDSETNRIYMLDYYVQAIGKRKVPYLDQLDVLIYTFNVPKEPGNKQ